MSAPICDHCGAEYTDPRGCDYADGDPKPVTFGDESEAFADLFGRTPATFNVGPTCSDCGCARGTPHHPECLRSECPSCHGQFGLCAGVDCVALRAWSTGQGGGTADAA